MPPSILSVSSASILHLEVCSVHFEHRLDYPIGLFSRYIDLTSMVITHRYFLLCVPLFSISLTAVHFTGVLYLHVHRATGVPKTDDRSKADPFVTVYYNGNEVIFWGCKICTTVF